MTIIIPQSIFKVAQQGFSFGAIEFNGKSD